LATVTVARERTQEKWHMHSKNKTAQKHYRFTGNHMFCHRDTFEHGVALVPKRDLCRERRQENEHMHSKNKTDSQVITYFA
jgi:hypothetical protein